MNTRQSYDRVADKYGRRICDGLRQKPLDRDLLGRFAAGAGSSG
jgi:hypothetical protein